MSQWMGTHLRRRIWLLAEPGAGQGTGREVAAQLPTGCDSILGRQKDNSSSFSAALAGFQGTPTPAPHLLSDERERLGKMEQSSVAFYSAAQQGASGGGRQGKAPQNSGSWSCFLEQSKTWKRANIPCPVPIPGKGLRCERHETLCGFGWLGIAGSSCLEEAGASKEHLPSPPRGWGCLVTSALEAGLASLSLPTRCPALCVGISCSMHGTGTSCSGRGLTHLVSTALLCHLHSEHSSS